MAGYVDKLTVIIKRNAGYEKGLYGLSFHDQPGGAANDVIDRLQNKHDSVRLRVDPAVLKKERHLAYAKSPDGVMCDCDRCSWKVLMDEYDIDKAHQLFYEHVCADHPPLK